MGISTQLHYGPAELIIRNALYNLLLIEILNCIVIANYPTMIQQDQFLHLVFERNRRSGDILQHITFNSIGTFGLCQMMKLNLCSGLVSDDQRVKN